MVGRRARPGGGALSGRLVLRAHGPQPPDVVWERYARPSAWSSWSPQIRRVDVTSDRIRTGLRGTVRSYAPGRLLGLPFEVVAVDERARTWSWVVSLGPLRVALDHAVTPDPAGGPGSATELVLRGPWLLIGPYAPLAVLALRRLVR